METMTALSVVNLLPSNKHQVKLFTHDLKQEILANDRDPLKILVQLKMIERVLEDILKDDDLDRHFASEFMLYGAEKVLEVNGAKLQQCEVGVKYDYSASGDPKWFELDKQLKELTEKKKEREKFLQSIPYESQFVDPDTGVFLTRPPKSSKSKIKVTL